MIKFVFGLCPVFVKYVDQPHNGFAGTSRACFIEIKKGYEEDKGLLAHEMTHCKQFYRTFGIGDLLYTYSKKCKLKYELEAYKVQLSYDAEDQKDRKAGIYAKFIATRYDLKVDEEEIKTKLLA